MRRADELGPGVPFEVYSTSLGTMLVGTIEEALKVPPLSELTGKVDLIFTSPPFPLARKKRYGNLTGDAYVDWLGSIALQLGDLLTPKGSLVIEIGNAWEIGKPVMSTLPLKALLKILEAGKFNLCQQFICHNPARLPSPVQWVNVRRFRVKDSFTHVWWMSRDTEPKADNRKVLQPYTKSMQKLLRSQSYNSGARPSGHVIGEKSFLTDNGGAIPSSVLQFSNTMHDRRYSKYCKDLGLPPHPATMPSGLVEFFINFLTDKESLVLDPFAGSNTTGAVAETLGRKWIGVEAEMLYARGSIGRMPQNSVLNLADAGS